MKIQVSGKHVDVGDALKTRVEVELTSGISKYFERGGDADVTFCKEGFLFKADCLVKLASGQTLVAHGTGGDAHSAFDSLLERIEARVRRYKRRLKNHHAPVRSELASVTVLRAADFNDDDDIDDGLDPSAPPSAMVIAETEAPLKTMTVSAAVLEMEMSNYPVILFRNAGHGGLSVIYRRPDGNIGWIDPERTARAKVA
jgi:ribosomal subunit interface protein